MPRSCAQSDFSVSRPEPVVPVAIALPPGARTVELPSPPPASHEASAFASRWVLRVALLMLLALALLCAIGPHIPSGE